METRLLLALALVTASLASLVSAASLEFEITIPDAVQVTEKQDAYMCTTLALPDKPYKLVGVEPLGKKEIVHHILLFGEFSRCTSIKSAIKMFYTLALYMQFCTC